MQPCTAANYRELQEDIQICPNSREAAYRARYAATLRREPVQRCWRLQCRPMLKHRSNNYNLDLDARVRSRIPWRCVSTPRVYLFLLAINPSFLLGLRVYERW